MHSVIIHRKRREPVGDGIAGSGEDYGAEVRESGDNRDCVGWMTL